MKRTISALLACTLIISLLSVIGAAAPVTLTLSRHDYAVTVGKTATLTASVNAGNEISWTSSDPSVAAVTQSGVVSGVSAGSAVITASCGTARAECTVRVTPVFASPVQGLDVSAYQGVINWQKLAASGMKFVIIRLGYGTSSATGKITIDKYWAQNVAGAKAAGLDIGVYLYSYAKTPEASANEARQVITELNKYPRTFTYPVWFDFEDGGCKTNPVSTNVSIVKAFCDALENAGYYSGVYTYVSYMNSYLDKSALSSYDTWMASFGTNDGNPHNFSYGGAYGIWQYTSNGVSKVQSGSVQSSGLDLDYAYKDYAKVIINAGLNGFSGSVTATGETEEFSGIDLDFTDASAVNDALITGAYTLGNGELYGNKNAPVLQSRYEGTTPPTGYVWKTYDTEITLTASPDGSDDRTVSFWYCNYGLGGVQYVKFGYDTKTSSFTLAIDGNVLAEKAKAVTFDESAPHVLGMSVGVGRIRGFIDGICVIDVTDGDGGWGLIASPLVFYSRNNETRITHLTVAEYGSLFDPEITVSPDEPEPDEPAAVPGDANGDGVFTTADATHLSRYLAGYSVEVSPSADYNGDGIVNTSDCNAMLRALAGFVS